MAKVPKNIREKYQFWKNVVLNSGPEGLGRIRGFNDEQLKGELQHLRSSRLNDAYRVIYEVDGNALCVKVEKVTNHVYR